MANSSEQNNLFASSSASETKESTASTSQETSSASNAPESSSATESSATDSAVTSDAPKPMSKKFHQQEFKAPSGRKYLMTFPGVQKAMQLQSANNSTNVSIHTMYMTSILEGKYSYAYFDGLDDGVSREKTITATNDAGDEETYHVKFQSFKQLDEIQDQAFNGLVPDPYQMAVFTFENLIVEDVSFDYFDTHSGLSEILDGVFDLFTDLANNSEYGLVMNAVSNFLNNMFR